MVVHSARSPVNCSVNRSVNRPEEPIAAAGLLGDRNPYNSRNRLKNSRIAMKPILLSTVGMLTIAVGLTLGANQSVAAQSVAAQSAAQSTANLSSASQPGLLISQNSRAEQTCAAAARDRGFRNIEITAVNESSNGAEVILEAQQGRNRSTIGCDYSSATRDVELYRIEGDSSDDSDDNWRNQYSGDGIRNEQDAASAARRVVGQELGINDLSVVEIDDVQQDDRAWIVEGNANGAPFEVRLRSEDGSVQDFQLF
jgi:hypothetical protein